MSISLTQFSITGRDAGPHLLITGAVHGDEFEPIAAVRALIAHCAAADFSATLRGRLTLVPIVNEPAFLRGHRCGPDDRDLARTCPGRPDGSITEQIAHALTQLIQSADYYIDLHTGGTELAVYPLAGYMLHDDSHILDTQRRMARAFNLPVVWGTSAELEGRSMSVARDARVPAIYCEYYGSAICRPEGVQAYIAGCLNVMAELGMIQRNRPAQAIRYIIEDRRPQSGHMQVCNPAVLDGYFAATVQVGDLVQQGDMLGTITGMDSRSVVPVSADQTGVVLVLRTFPRVRAGEGLAVIMPTDLEGTPPAGSAPQRSGIHETA